MKYAKPIGAILVMAVVVFLAWKAFDNNPAEPGTVSSGDQAAVERVVTEFGQKLKLVSLLAPATTLRASMEEQYGPYVQQNLIEEWLRNPQNAPGRLTSSPSPSRIDVVETNQNSNGSYTVEGNLIETAIGTSGQEEPASVRAVSITLEKTGDRWLIADFLMKTVSELPQRTTIVGTYACLPHKNTGGPQTLECAFGIRTDNGDYYAFDTSLMSQTPPILATGDRISANGTITPIEALSSMQWQKYDIKGIFSVTDSLKKITATQPTGDAAGIANLITVTSPTINQKVSSPLTVTGSARGTWYFEASFPVELRSSSGALISQTPAQAQSNWMTENFVNFKATLVFPAQPAGSKGTLILRKDNPSGDPERDQRVSVPVTF